MMNRRRESGFMQLLEALNVSKVFGDTLLSRRRLVPWAGFSLMNNEAKPTTTAIAGESGSGKTTLARLLLGITQPSAGSIRFRGQELANMNRQDRKGFR